ncbi:hypothetical protein JTE90_010563 [Oedothorax gibbosus]|uniref:Uncharacterized protein n=1 Tax=Oedothorax gibbosus TaxID=931172 RepID=A0AAV6UEZ1_9ARAC|nr:hypothetical protein JTE90_010563 [Oedothorax gibbosus]
MNECRGNDKKVRVDGLSETVDVIQEFDVDTVKVKKVAKKLIAKNLQAKLEQCVLSASGETYIKELCFPCTSSENDINRQCVSSASGEFNSIKELCVPSTSVETDIKELCVPFPSYETSEEKTKLKKSNNEQGGDVQKVPVYNWKETAYVFRKLKMTLRRPIKPPLGFRK